MELSVRRFPIGSVLGIVLVYQQRHGVYLFANVAALDIAPATRRSIDVCRMESFDSVFVSRRDRCWILGDGGEVKEG